MKNNNLLLLCPVYEPHSGGGGQYFPLFIQIINKYKFFKKIYILTEYHPSKKIITFEKNLIILRMLFQRDTVKQKNIINHYIFYFCNYFIMFILITFLILFKRVRILHFTRFLTLQFVFFLKIIKKLFNILIVLDMRTVTDSRKEISCLKKFNFLDLIISNSLSVKYQIDNIETIKNNNSYVVNPIELPRSKGRKNILKTSKNEFLFKRYILFVGSIVNRKSIIEIVKAFMLIKNKIPNYKLIIIGRNIIGKSFLDLINKEKNILYIGEKPREITLDFIECSELVLQPSRIEGIPRVSIETLSLQKKILLPSCVPEFNEMDFFLTNEITPKSIAKKILELISSNKIPYYDCNKHSVINYENQLKEVYSNLI